MKNFDELANAVIDGVATPAERAAFEASLERDPAARERFKTLELAVRALGRVRTVETPVDLKDQVMDAVRGQGTFGTPPVRRFAVAAGTSLAERMSRALGLRVAAAFAAGVAVTAIVFTIASGGRPLGGSSATGTMAPPITEPRGMILDTGRARAAFELTTTGDVASVRITTDTTDPTIVEISWPAGRGEIRARLRSGDAVDEGTLAAPPGPR